MKPVTILLAILYSGFIAYSVVLFISGETGLYALDEKKHYRDNLLMNIDDLENINKNLNSELATMRTSEEKNRVLARTLGYYSNYEYRLVLPFRSVDENLTYAGKILKMPGEKSFMKHARISFGVIVISAILACGLLVSRKRVK